MEYRENINALSTSHSVPNSPPSTGNNVNSSEANAANTEADSVASSSSSLASMVSASGAASGGPRYKIHESLATIKKGRRSSLSDYERHRGDLDSLWGEMRKSFAEEKNAGSLSVAAAAARAVAIAAEALANSIEESASWIECSDSERFPDIPRRGKVRPAALAVHNLASPPIPKDPRLVKDDSRSAEEQSASPTLHKFLPSDETSGIASAPSFLSKSHSVGPGKPFPSTKPSACSPLIPCGQAIMRSASQSLLYDLAAAAEKEKEEARDEETREECHAQQQQQQRQIPSNSSANDMAVSLSSAPSSSDRLFSESSLSPSSSQPSNRSSNRSGLLTLSALPSPNDGGDARRVVRKDSVLREKRFPKEASAQGQPESPNAASEANSAEPALSSSQQIRRREGVRRVSSCHAVIDETPPEAEKDSSFRARLLALGLPNMGLNGRSMSSESDSQEGSPQPKSRAVKKAKSILMSTMGLLTSKGKVQRAKKAGQIGVEVHREGDF
eukprot:TRINITY_DN23863_c0_g1_i1.p1 TRINITY_DN23863_c0_g1~~TRINITY_DN23863_c0_g1_i1.p1  ORF type:complete len:501 (+),score=80.20 TRINITY_DN23863_c0_g1_i1:575-2077(+)